MDYTEISVDPKFHRHLIGKSGANSEYTAVVKFKADIMQTHNACAFLSTPS